MNRNDAENSSRETTPTLSEWDARRLERLNSTPGKLSGPDCPKCRNRGFYYVWDEKTQDELYHVCECMPARKAFWRMKKSGLAHGMEKLTFTGYQAEEDWQKHLKQGAMDYAAQPSGWLFLGGQVGCGKTHLCTAVLEQLSHTYPVMYMLWRDEAARIKTALNDPEGLRRMERLKTAPVLYIDESV